MQQISAFSLATKISGLSCPSCSSTAYHKYGTRLGVQRFRCRNCGRTFNETVNTPFHRIRDKQKMQEYLLTMHDQQSIRAASATVGISVPTSFSWRHRILTSLQEMKPTAGSSPAGICEIKLPHSFKGQRGINKKKMPETHSLLIADVRGIPCLKLLVSKKKPFEAALLITKTIQSTISIEIAKTNLLSRAYRKISLVKTQNRYEAKSLAKHSEETAYKLTAWMSRFNGVATKYLQQYWNWFCAESNLPSFDHFRSECFGHRRQYQQAVHMK